MEKYQILIFQIDEQIFETIGVEVDMQTLLFKLGIKDKASKPLFEVLPSIAKPPNFRKASDSRFKGKQEFLMYSESEDSTRSKKTSRFFIV